MKKIVKLLSAFEGLFLSVLAIKLMDFALAWIR